jgi:hypothetical protein
MSGPLVTGGTGDAGGQGSTQGDQRASKEPRKRGGFLTFAVAAVLTAVVASGLTFTGVAIFGNGGSAAPSRVDSSPGAHPGNATPGNGDSQHGNGSGQPHGQGAAKAKAARDRAASAAAKSRASGN